MMSFLKAVFFTLPLMAIAAVGLAYLLHTQTVQPRVEEILQKLEAATTQMEQAATAGEVTQQSLQQINTKLDTLLARP
jgi:Flp pilus assembly protein TadB